MIGFSKALRCYSTTGLSALPVLYDVPSHDNSTSDPIVCASFLFRCYACRDQATAAQSLPCTADGGPACSADDVDSGRLKEFATPLASSVCSALQAQPQTYLSAKCCSLDGCNSLGLQVPILPMVDSDPFNPQASGVHWSTQLQSPAENVALGFFPTDTVPYVSVYFLSGRPCGYLYVESPAMLPQEGAAVLLSGAPLVSFTVVQNSDASAATAGAGLPVRPAHSFLCSADGQFHALPSAAGRWAYNVRS
eukprot:CAMPEP_0172166138 /NCGR_PEP_ID=MMETSP1050-20130122/8811_1 /TAXON_ID=233186 /ORGANISM="Cryptomonas curvata, Strain CCAP979/52" /LENGTH=249 /DNA_ID=CAMNT_0012836707 /DNA_START=389 /DNA_END=1135 /DNA_ORIENTATION=+